MGPGGNPERPAMCGFCGSSLDSRHWTTIPVTDARATRARFRLAEAAGRLCAAAGFRLAPWGNGFQVTGRTGRRELASDLAQVWRLADRLGSPVDPLDDSILDRLEREL